MFTLLTGIVIALSVVGLIAAVGPWSGMPSRWRALKEQGVGWLPATVALTAVILSLFTVPAHPPFADGMRLGLGFLTGALLGAYVLWQSAGQRDEQDWLPCLAGTLSAVLLGPALALVLFKDYPNDALMGCALGALFAGILGTFALRGRLLSSRGVILYALGTSAIAAAGRLAIEHHFAHATQPDRVTGYWILPALLLAVSLLVLLLFRPKSTPLPQKTAYVAGIAAVAAMAIMAGLFRIDLFEDINWLLLPAGLIALAIPLGTLLHQEEQSLADPEGFRPLGIAFAAIVLVLGLAAVAFKLQTGYGEALVLLGMLPLIASVAMAQPSRQFLAVWLGMSAAALMLFLLFFRIFQFTTGYSRPLTFQEHYDLIALLLGVGAIFAWNASLLRAKSITASLPPGWQPLLLFLQPPLWLGAAICVSPPLITVLWGARGTGAYLTGLIAGGVIWMLFAAMNTGVERSRVLATSPFLVVTAAEVFAIQFSPLVLRMNLTKTQSIHAAIDIVVGAVILALLLTGLASPALNRALSRAATPSRKEG